MPSTTDYSAAARRNATGPPAANPRPADAAEVARLCREAGCPDLAEVLIAAHATPDAVAVRLERAGVVRALCANAKLPELAAGYITADVPIEIVRAHLTAITTRLDRAEMETGGHKA
jgi:hypothetical protein